ncbi:MAG: spermidine/putrescine ABC transporter ATP-binding protein [Chloroflexi bacterium]|nr:MAG: spermidine/putrescine ABC transporter ATP-binding protein [Chloroflexota bacterium]
MQAARGVVTWLLFPVELNMLVFSDIEKSFEGKLVLRGVSYALAAGKILVLLGPSGCGKTTLLRIIAGLEAPDAGQLKLDGEDLAKVPVHKRGFGFVFQDYALFPHKNVFDNVAFGLRMHKWSHEQMRSRVTQVLALVDLAGFDERSIHDLSGGEQQRVALARAIAPAPRLLLLDEPLGALDRALRERLMLDLRVILKEAGGVVGRPEGITAVYVTHDQAEAFAIADQVVVMSQGRIEQIGSPTALYRQPATPFVARFLGMENVFAGVVQRDVRPEEARAGRDSLGHSSFVVRTVLGDVEVALPSVSPQRLRGEKVSLLIRPEAGRLTTDGEAANVVQGIVRDVSFRGRYQIVTLQVGDAVLKLEMETAVILPEAGHPITITLDKTAILLLEGA